MAQAETFTVPADFAQQCLISHNKHRAQHGSPPLSLNDNLSQFAQEWADSLAKRKTLEHRADNKYGENIFFSSGQKVTPDLPVKMWYSEIKDYNFNQAKFSPKTGHFTQVVWKGSKELGVGITYNGNSCYVVANYDPPGNFQGQFKQNVPPKK